MITLTCRGGEPIALETAATTRKRNSARCLPVSGCRSIWMSGMVSGLSARLRAHLWPRRQLGEGGKVYLALAWHVFR